MTTTADITDPEVWVGSEPSDPRSGDGRLVALVLAGYPIAWLVGLGPAVFLVAAMLMSLWLIRNRPLLVPPGTILFGMFLVLVLASVVEVNSPGRAGIWLMRTSWYASALITWVFLARQTSVQARRLILYALVATWVMAIVGGYAALLAPDLSWRTPLSAIMPGAIGDDSYVQELVQPRVAEIQTFFPDLQLNRPAAPYAYTNAWGSNVALLTPFLFALVQERRLRPGRWLVSAALVAGFVPFYYALNRGAWLTLGAGLVYGIVRSAVVGRRLLPILVLAGLGVVSLLAVTATGLLDTAAEQLEVRSIDSNETRADVYLQTIEHSADSPLIGFGTPRPNPSNPTGPPLGTHGQLWAIMFAHGYIATGLYVGFFVAAFLRARGRDPVTNWAKVALFIGLLQLPIYGHLPTQLFVMVTAAAVASWPRDAVVVPAGGDGSRQGPLPVAS